MKTNNFRDDLTDTLAEKKNIHSGSVLHQSTWLWIITITRYKVAGEIRWLEGCERNVGEAQFSLPLQMLRFVTTEHCHNRPSHTLEPLKCWRCLSVWLGPSWPCYHCDKITVSHSKMKFLHWPQSGVIMNNLHSSGQPACKERKR